MRKMCRAVHKMNIYVKVGDSMSICNYNNLYMQVCMYIAIKCFQFIEHYMLSDMTK